MSMLILRPRPRPILDGSPAARMFDCAKPSTPRRWRGGWLGHHGRGVLPFFLCCGWLSHLSSVEKWYETAASSKKRAS